MMLFIFLSTLLFADEPVYLQTITEKANFWKAAIERVKTGDRSLCPGNSGRSMTLCARQFILATPHTHSLDFAMSQLMATEAEGRDVQMRFLEPLAANLLRLETDVAALQRNKTQNFLCWDPALAQTEVLQRIEKKVFCRHEPEDLNALIEKLKNEISSVTTTADRQVASADSNAGWTQERIVNLRGALGTFDKKSFQSEPYNHSLAEIEDYRQAFARKMISANEATLTKCYRLTAPQVKSDITEFTKICTSKLDEKIEKAKGQRGAINDLFVQSAQCTWEKISEVYKKLNTRWKPLEKGALEQCLADTGAPALSR